MRDLAFLLCFMGPLVMSWGRAYVSILTWAWIAILTPNFFMFGIAGSVPYNKLIAGVTFLAILTSKERKKFRIDATAIVLLMFLAQLAIAQFSALTDQSVGWDILDKFWKIVIFFFLVLAFADSPNRIHALVLATCLGIDFDACAGGLKFFASAGSYHSVGSPSWGDNNHEALIMLMGIPLLTYVRNVSTEKLMRFATSVAIVLSVFGVVATQSRGGLVGLMICAGFGILRSRHKVGFGIIVAVLAMITLYVAGEHYTARMDTIGSAEQDDSFMGRVVAWKISTLMAMDNPMTGGGIHAVTAPSVYDYYARDFYKLSFISTPSGPGVAHAAHSIYFEVLGDSGFLGLGLFLTIVVSSLVRAWRCKNLARHHPELRWAYVLAGQLQTSIVVYMVCGAALSAGYYDLPYLTFSIVSAVSAYVTAQVAAKKKAAMAGERTAARALARPVPPGGFAPQPAGFGRPG